MAAFWRATGWYKRQHLGEVSPATTFRSLVIYDQYPPIPIPRAAIFTSNKWQDEVTQGHFLTLLINRDRQQDFPFHVHDLCGKLLSKISKSIILVQLFPILEGVRPGVTDQEATTTTYTKSKRERDDKIEKKIHNRHVQPLCSK
ncbi:hypothetical protein TNCV_765081 [Trichonephila clavipes]|nr:hypothetical protein TNCV_765081 [Trichonephila clavipes]